MVVEQVSRITFYHEDDAGQAFPVCVEWRGENQYAVTHHRQVLTRDGQWEWEPLPSSRTPDFIARTRFDLGTARRLAAEQAERIYQEYVAQMRAKYAP